MDQVKTRRLPLYTLFVTTLISVTGDVMAAIAIPWFVLETTGSTIQMGIVAFFSVSPIVIGMFFGGTLVDRLGYKRVSAVADSASGITILLIPILHTTMGLEFWQLLLLVFLGNLMDSPGRSARRAMLPELAQSAGMSLERATGLNQSLQRATAMIGAPIAGLLIATAGAPGVLAIDAITFGVSALGVFLFIPSRLIDENKATSDNTYWQDLKEGYRFVQQDRLLLSLIIVIMVTNMIDYSMSAVTYPVYMRTAFGTQEGATLFGLLVGLFGASALISGLVFSWLGDRIRRQNRLLAIVFILLAIRFFVFATFPPIWGLAIIILFSGLAAGPINPILDTITYRRVPDTMRGRVFGILSAGVLIAMPLGGVVGGHLLEWLNLQATLVIYGIFYILATGSLFFNRQIQVLDTLPQATDTAD
jgi:MFS family permease